MPTTDTTIEELIAADPMGNKILVVPDWMMVYCQNIAPLMVPSRRVGGFKETANQTRGSGDLMDLVASQMLFYLFGKYNRVVSVDTTIGTGDDKDLVFRIEGRPTTWNVKTSGYAPYRDGLNLMLKSEELNKKLDGYIQVMVHLNELDQPPHLHLLGSVEVGSDIWKHHTRLLTSLPISSHPGVMIPASKLTKISDLLRRTDRKF